MIFTFFAIFENAHIAINWLYFNEFNSIKSANFADAPARVECGIFFIGQNRSSNQRSGSGMILKVQIQSSGARASVGARASKFLYSKKSRGLKYQYFFLKIRMWLPFGFQFFIEFSIYR